MAEHLSHIRHIREAIKGRSWLLRIFGWLLIVAVAFQFALGYFRHPANWDSQIDRAVIIAGFFLLLIGSIFREVSRIRKEKYANIGDKYETIQSSIKELNTVLDYIGNAGIKDVEQFRKTFTGEIIFVLDTIAELFAMVTGTTCRAAIKSVFEEDGAMFVFAFARDKRSNAVNARSDKERHEGRQDRLEKNDDFHSTFNEKKRYFFDGDLPQRYNYNNSSIEYYGGRPDGANWFQRTFFPRRVGRYRTGARWYSRSSNVTRQASRSNRRAV